MNRLTEGRAQLKLLLFTHIFSCARVLLDFANFLSYSHFPSQSRSTSSFFRTIGFSEVAQTKVLHSTYLTDFRSSLALLLCYSIECDLLLVVCYSTWLSIVIIVSRPNHHSSRVREFTIFA